MKLTYIFSLPLQQFATLIVNILRLSAISSEATGKILIEGVGGSFSSEVYAQWISNYMPLRRVFIDLEMIYNVTGSSKALEMIQHENSVDFAGSEKLLPANANKNLKMFPTMAGAVSISYNLPEVSKLGFQLNLSREQLVGIYNGTFTNWNDSTFAQTNPNAQMPNATIKVIVRYGKSGTTDMFTTALSSFDAKWKQRYGVFSEGVSNDNKTPEKWNPNVVTFFGKKNSGMAGILASIAYSIGYVVIAEAKRYGLSFARVENKDGNFVSPDDITSIESAIEKYVNGIVDYSLTEKLTDIQADVIYPILGFTYMIVHLEYPRQCNVAKEILRFIQWFTTNDYAKSLCVRAHMIPITNTLKENIAKDILSKMTCNGENVWKMVSEDQKKEKKVEEKWKIPVAVLVPLSCVMLFALMGYILYQRLKLMKMINNNEWNIDIENILFYYDDKGCTKKSKMTFFRSVRSFKSIQDIPDGEMILAQILQWPGRWKGQQIGIRLLNVPDFSHIDQKTKRELIWMRENILHSNVLRFYGLTEIDYNDRFAVNEYCSKGVLTEILQDVKYNFTTDFRFSLSFDIVSGMSYLHAMGIIHGSLHSSCCMIDSRWTVKIADWEYCRLYSVMNSMKNPLEWKRKINGVPEDEDFIVNDFWVAPEILASNFIKFPVASSDVYSFAIILQEIFTRDEPYTELIDSMSLDEIFNAIIFNNLRPQTNDDTPVQVRQIMEIAWSPMANCRPTFDQIHKMLKHANPYRKSVLDTMMEAMEEYTEHLETRIEERTNEVKMAKERVEKQLSRYIPKFVLQNVTSDEHFQLNSHLDKCLFGIEICEFKEFLVEKQMEDITSVLKRIHFLIEDKVSRENISQIATDSSTWIYLSGMENESDRRDRVTTMAELALDLINTFKKSDSLQNLEIRAAIHIGDIHAGIAEHSKAVYVFSQDLLELKHLLNSSKPSKIQISKQIKDILDINKCFHVDEDTASLTTCYWLISRTKSVEMAEVKSNCSVVRKDCESHEDITENEIIAEVRLEVCPKQNNIESTIPFVQLKASPEQTKPEITIPQENINNASSLHQNSTQSRKSFPLSRTSNKICPIEQ
ncbi:receptor-type guanylate cyclase gcy-5-like [Argonauta hians]